MINIWNINMNIEKFNVWYIIKILTITNWKISKNTISTNRLRENHEKQQWSDIINRNTYCKSGIVNTQFKELQILPKFYKKYSKWFPPASIRASLLLIYSFLINRLLLLFLFSTIYWVYECSCWWLVKLSVCVRIQCGS